MTKFLTFAAVGSVTYFVDAFLFWFFLLVIEQPLVARVGSLLLAMTFSWYVNKKVTFRHVQQPNSNFQLFAFMISQMPGAIANTLVSSYTYSYVSLIQNNPFLAVGLGSLAGLLINFFLADRVVFKTRQK